MWSTGVGLLVIFVSSAVATPDQLPCARKMDGTEAIMNVNPAEANDREISSVGGVACGGTLGTGVAYDVIVNAPAGHQWALEAIGAGAAFDPVHPNSCSDRTTSDDPTPKITFASEGTVTIRMVSASGFGVSVARSEDCILTVAGVGDGNDEDEDEDEDEEDEEICVVGYIMDTFCINRGTLFDNPSINTLEQPEEHSIHCLIDVSQCVSSGFEVLIDAPVGRKEHCRGFRLGSAGSEQAKDLAAATGKSGGSCTECTNTAADAPTKGFRATVKGVRTSHPTNDAAGTITVTSVEAADVGCGSNAYTPPAGVCEAGSSSGALAQGSSLALVLGAAVLALARTAAA